MKTLNEKIQDLKKEYQIKNKKIRLEHKIKKESGIDNLIIYDLNKFAFFWSGKKASKKEVLKIVKKYPISRRKEDNFELTFADSSKNTKTDSNVYLTWCNYSHTNDISLKINYTCTQGYKISINIPNNFYPENYSFWKVKQGKHLGFGRYEHERSFYIDTPFHLQKYAGGTCKYYFLEGAESLSEYYNFIFTGEFVYNDEIKNKLFKS